MAGINSERLELSVLGIPTAYYRKAPQRAAGATACPTVVLFHGGAPGVCADLNWFRNFDALVEAGYDVIAFDQPGFGHSGIPEDHTIEFRYRHALAFLQALGLESVHLIGNSIGGLLCTLIAHRTRSAPIVRSLVLSAPFPFFDVPPEVIERLAKHRSRLESIEPTFDSIRKLCMNTFNQPEQVTDDVVALRLSMLQGDRWTAYKTRSKSARDFDQEEVREAVLDTPTLMVWGLNDLSLPSDIGVAAMQHFSDGQFLFLPHCGHWPQTEQAKIFNRSTIDFLGDQER